MLSKRSRTRIHDRLCELSQADRSIESESGLENRPPANTLAGGRSILARCRYNRHSAAERDSQYSHLCSSFVYKNHNKMKVQ